MKRIQRFCIMAFCLLALAVPAVGSRVFVDVTAASTFEARSMPLWPMDDPLEATTAQ